MIRMRAPCADCGLPYYTGENDACPYCGHEHRAESAHEHESRPRAPCVDCGLPYYSKENEACPYCGNEDSGEVETEPAPPDLPTPEAPEA